MMRIDELISRYRARENPLKAERRLELVALGLLLILVIQLVWGGLSVVRASFVTAIPPSQDVLNVGKREQISLIEVEARNEIVARPVFWQGRTPLLVAELVGVEAATEDAAGQKIEGVKLVGIYGSGSSGGAILKGKGGKRRVAVGEEAEGWLLDSVEPNSATFVRGASIDELQLQRVNASELVKVVPSTEKQEPEKAQSKPTVERTLSVGGTK
ncbi:MAG: hypothetical protein ABJ056_04350 [Halioglobus sp.]